MTPTALQAVQHPAADSPAVDSLAADSIVADTIVPGEQLGGIVLVDNSAPLPPPAAPATKSAAQKSPTAAATTIERYSQPSLIHPPSACRMTAVFLFHLQIERRVIFSSFSLCPALSK